MGRISDDGLIQIPDGQPYAPVRTRHGPKTPQMTVATDPYRRTLWHTLAVLLSLSSADATPAKGLLTFTLVGLPPTEHVYLSWTHCLVKTKSTFEINNLKKRDVTMLHAIWLGEITIRHGQV